MLVLSGTAKPRYVNPWYQYTFSHQDKLNPSQDYLGCYKDDKSDHPWNPRSLARHMKHFDGTILDCMRKCANEFQQYAGLQNGHLCFCGSGIANLMKYGRADDKECNMACDHGYPDKVKPLKKGHFFESCGGKWRNAVYDVKGLLLQRDRIARPKKMFD